MNHQEHNPAHQTYYPMARRIVTLGFTGTYTDKDAEFEPRRSSASEALRYHAGLRLLIGD